MPGVGTVADEDIVGYDEVAGTFALYFDGSDVGMTSSSEDLDGASVTASGDLVLSTTGAFSVSGSVLFDFRGALLDRRTSALRASGETP